MFPHFKISDLTKSFINRVNNFHIEIIKHIQVSTNNINFELIYISIMMHLMMKIIS